MLNGKFYIGAHKTHCLDDNYMGSGMAIKRAISKYGIDLFKKEILFIFDNKDDMFEKEKELVNEELVNREDTYNLTIGGRGSFAHMLPEQSSEVAKKGRKITNQKLFEKYGEDWHAIISEKARIKSREALAILKQDPTFIEKATQNSIKGRQACLTNEAKQKRKETMKKNGHSQGMKNSQFGTMWINNSTENKKIGKDDLIPDGWVKGRITI